MRRASQVNVDASSSFGDRLQADVKGKRHDVWASGWIQYLAPLNHQQDLMFETAPGNAQFNSEDLSPT